MEQPPVPETVYVMVVVPADNGVIKPVAGFIDATNVELEDHAPPAVPPVEIY